jgi:hypothetical protein
MRDGRWQLKAIVGKLSLTLKKGNRDKGKNWRIHLGERLKLGERTSR